MESTMLMEICVFAKLVAHWSEGWTVWPTTFVATNVLFFISFDHTTEAVMQKTNKHTNIISNDFFYHNSKFTSSKSVLGFDQCHNLIIPNDSSSVSLIWPSRYLRSLLRFKSCNWHHSQTSIIPILYNYSVLFLYVPCAQ